MVFGLTLLAIAMHYQGMFFKDWDSYRKALSVAHILMKRYGIWDDLTSYFNRHVDFISSTDAMDPMMVVNTMHSLILLICGNMTKYYQPKTIAVVLNHALTHCVQSLALGFPKPIQNMFKFWSKTQTWLYDCMINQHISNTTSFQVSQVLDVV